MSSAVVSLAEPSFFMKLRQICDLAAFVRASYASVMSMRDSNAGSISVARFVVRIKEGLLGCLARPFYPMSLPTTYTGIRHHAMRACEAFALADAHETLDAQQPSALIAKLWKQHRSRGGDSALDSADVASECADHLLAGIETTSGTLMFLIWSLSRPDNSHIRERLMKEVRAMPSAALNAHGIPRVDASDRLEYVNAVIKETLRLYAPLPGSEPRSLPVAATIDGYIIPPRVIVSMSPYVLHRNPKVFKEPLRFNPDRWLDPSNDILAMNRSFWAFSSGARMCIGIHLAMAEMTTLVAAIYRRYTTAVAGSFDTSSPGISSRYEVFFDESCNTVQEHKCEIRFEH